MRRGDLPEPIGESVSSELDRLGGSPGGPLSELVAIWPAAVGETVARNAWPARRSRDGTLVVHVTSSAWAFELQQLESMVRDRLGDLAPPRLRFVPGPVPDRDPGVGVEGRPKPPVPSAADRAEAEREAARIESADLRDAVRAAIAASLARARTHVEPAGPSDTLG